MHSAVGGCNLAVLVTNARTHAHFFLAIIEQVAILKKWLLDRDRLLLVCVDGVQAATSWLMGRLSVIVLLGESHETATLSS